MKRYLALSAIVATSLFAANNTQLVEYFKGQIQVPSGNEVKVEVVDRTKLKEHKDFDLVTLKIEVEDQSQEIRLFTKGNLLFPDIIDISSKKSLLKDIEKQALYKKLKPIYTQEDSKNIITVGNDPKKETLVIFTDPECPYCRNELANIEEVLKTYNVKLLMTPVHGRGALEKSYLIYKGIKEAKDDKAKIALMRKYYAEDVNISGEKVSDANVKAMEDLRVKYVGNVIRGVPFKVNEKEIK